MALVVKAGQEEPYEARVSRTVLRGRGGELPPRYSTPSSASIPFIPVESQA